MAKREKAKPKVVKNEKTDNLGRAIYPGYSWVKIEGKEESLRLQKEGKMAGFDPKRMEALVEEDKE